VPVFSWREFRGTETALVSTYFNGSESIHPNDAGHANIAEGINAYLAGIYEKVKAGAGIPDIPSDLPAPKVSDEFQRFTFINSDSASDIVSSEGWSVGSDTDSNWSKCGDVWWRKGWSTENNENAHLKVSVKGSTVGILYSASSLYRKCEAYLSLAETPEDEISGSRITINTYDSTRGGYFGWEYANVKPRAGAASAYDLDPAQEYILHVVVKTPFAGGDGVESGRISISGILVSAASPQTLAP
jgi:hypothetical protein